MSLAVQAKQRGIPLPQVRTVARYGLTVDEWLEMLAAQGWRCPICQKHRGVKWTTDHEHVRGWAKMEPEERKRFVRGVLCRHCNWKVVHSRLTAGQARRIAEYIEGYEMRRDGRDVVSNQAPISGQSPGASRTETPPPA